MRSLLLFETFCWQVTDGDYPMVAFTHENMNNTAGRWWNF